MKRVIRELRQRGVFRAAGLYIALTWLALQIADVVFPAFDIPDSSLRFILFGAIAGFPAVMLFSWFYDISAEGIRSEDEIRQAGEKRPGGYLSGATIVLLVFALGVSLYANYQQANEAASGEPQQPVSMLVADFINQTGDPIFDGSLEPALMIGMESAPFISAYARHQAAELARQIADSESLNEESARLVSVREGIDLVLVGEITPDGSGYTFSLHAIDPREGSVLSEASTEADSKADVLPAVGRLAIQMREELGDASLSEDSQARETFTAASLEAARYYTVAQAYNHKEQNEQASEYYRKAVEEDQQFGRAYAGWAMSARKLGRIEEAEALWQKALALLDTMTEREQYRTLGAYYLLVTGNKTKAIENYELLVKKYPADDVGRNNMAVTYFHARRFDEALEQGAKLVASHPHKAAYRGNYALYAMYAGDFDTARREAAAVLADNPDYFLPYLALAVSELAQGRLVESRAAYQAMASLGAQPASTATSGLADLALLAGDWERATELLHKGIVDDIASGNERGANHKRVYLAFAQSMLGNSEAALATLTTVLESSEDISHLLPAARQLIALGDFARAEAIRANLNGRLAQDSRAAADIIEADAASARGDVTAAVDALNRAIQRSDTWLARFDLGRAYFSAGYYAEALGEFELCNNRIGESTALFLDDIPTFHYSAALEYWLARSRQELGMTDAARDGYRKFLSLRVDSDQSENTRDARQRLGALE